MNTEDTTMGPPKPAADLLQRVVTYGRMIRFSHTVFALPFALAAVVLAARTHPVTWTAIGWVLVAMVGARSAAMGFNRLADADVDGKNPRTADREIPTGQLTRFQTAVFTAAAAALFVFAAGMLGTLCLVLSGPVLLVLLAYSYTKRFTWLSHIVLGGAIGLAPMGAWIAVTNGFSWSVCLLSAALMGYIAGFDILYSCQDVDVDRQLGLFSMPARFGAKKAMRMAAILHAIAWGCFCLLGPAFDLGIIYAVTVLVIGGLMVVEHRLVAPDDLTHINIAFFHMNSAISLVLFAGILLDGWVMP